MPPKLQSRSCGTFSLGGRLFTGRAFCGGGFFCGCLGGLCGYGQALGHILGNAIEYGSDDGEVLIAARHSADNAQIIISDNGPGMTEKQIDSIFDAKSAGDQAETDEGPSGLGLPFAKQLIDGHGGDFNVQSEIGVGTSVIITLPTA